MPPDDSVPLPPAPSGGGGSSPADRTRTSVDPLDRFAPGSLVSGRYRIRSLAGVGGMGVVYRARDEELREDVAVKVLRPDLGKDPSGLERFRNELRLARQITHPNVVRIHDIGEHEGLRFLTMRFIEGRSLRQILDKEGPMAPARSLGMFRQIAGALEQAHAAGIVHRDLKPENILVTSGDNAFVTDFGVAKSLSAGGLTRAGAVVGTPDYLAPEQITGEAVDGRTDIYALGILLFEMLSGELPFTGGSPSEMLGRRLAGRARDIADTGARIPAGLRSILNRCLERSPKRRFADVSALLHELERLEGGRPVGRQWPRFAAAAAGIALLSAGAVWIGRARSAPDSRTRPRSTRPSAAAPRHAIAFLPLADETSSSGLDWAAGGVPEMLAARLSENPDLRVLAPERVASNLGDLKLASGRYDDRTLAQLADLWGADRLACGTIRRAGSRVQLEIELAAIGPNGVIARHPFRAEAPRPEGLFAAVEALAREVRVALGAPPAAAKEPATRSIAAAQAVAGAEKLLLAGDSVRAAPLLERAVAADPHFADAFEKLSETYQNLGRHEKAAEAAARAIALVGAEDSPRAFRARARGALLDGNPAQAEKIYRQLLQRYPFDTGTRLDLAAAQTAQGHNADAVVTLQSAVQIDPNDVRGWFELGKNRILTGESSRALQEDLVRALALQSRLGSEEGKGDVLNAIGVAYQQLGDPTHALENYSAAAAARKSAGDDRGLASTLRNRALVANSLGRPAAAEKDLLASRALFQRLGDRHGEADILNDFGLVAEGRGNYDRALAKYKEALKLRQEQGDERSLAQSYDNVGYIYHLLGEYDNALVYWQQALDLRQRIGKKDGIVLSTQNMGFLQIAQGRWDGAARSFVRALDGAREIGMKDAMAVSDGYLGLLNQYRGRYAAALASYDDALAIGRELDAKSLLAEFTIKKAAALLEIGRFPEARSRLAETDAWIRQTGNREQEADRDVVRGRLELAAGHVDAASRAFAEARKAAAQSRSPVAILRTNVETRSASPEANLAQAEKLGNVLLTIEAAEAAAEFDLSARRFGAAAAAARRASKLAESCGWTAGLYRVLALEATIARSRGDSAAADRLLRRSRDELARIRSSLDPASVSAFEKLPSVRVLQPAKASGLSR